MTLDKSVEKEEVITTEQWENIIDYLKKIKSEEEVEKKENT